jgi:lipid-A-disaccharide synthase-like uncharacterized protein
MGFRPKKGREKKLKIFRREEKNSLYLLIILIGLIGSYFLTTLFFVRALAMEHAQLTWSEIPVMCR